jgi:hypothetical protein
MRAISQTIVVFQSQNLRKAEKFIRANPGAWTVVCAFDNTTANSHRVVGVDYVNLFDRYPYQPKLVTQRVRQSINAIFENTFLNGRNLNESLIVEGVPLLRAKDNEVMEYVLHRLVFVVDVLIHYLESSGQTKVWLLTDSANRMTIPEWPSFERWLDLDAVYGPVLARAALASGVDVNFAAAISLSRSAWLHAMREAVLMTTRLISVFKRGLWWRKRRLELDSDRPKLAIWVRAKGQVREVEPLVRKWLAEGRVLPFFIQDDSFKKQDCFDYLASEPELPFVSLYSFVTPKIFLNAFGLYLWFRFIAIRKLVFHPITKSSEMAVDSVILSPLFRRELVKSLAESIFASSIVVREMSACHASTRFAVMLVMSIFDLWGNLSAYVAKTRGFRTIGIQNFLNDPWAYPTPCTLYDGHVCFDELEKARLVQAGASPDKIFVLGSVTHSTLRNVASQSSKRRVAREKLGLDGRELVILVGTQSASADASSQNSHLLRLLFDVVSENEHAVGLVKLHPYESLSDYSEWIEKAAAQKLPIRFLDNWNIDEAMHAADAYISRFSTTMLLGVMLRKPTLSYIHPFELQRVRDSVDFVRTGIITSVTEYSEARQWVTGLYSEDVYAGYISRQEERLTQHFSTFDEYAEDRIRKLVEDFLFRALPASESAAEVPTEQLHKVEA